MLSENSELHANLTKNSKRHLPKYIKFLKLKAAFINIFLSAMDQMIKCNMKGFTYSEKPTDNYVVFPALCMPSSDQKTKQKQV